MTDVFGDGGGFPFPGGSGTSTVGVSVAGYIRPGDNGNTSLALQRAFDALPSGGGILYFSDTQAWNFATKVYVDKVSATAWTVTLTQDSKTQPLTVNTTLQKEASCTMVNGTSSFTCPAAGSNFGIEDIGAVVQVETGATNFGFKSGTTITTAVLAGGTWTIGTSNAWQGTSGVAALRVQRAVIYLNIGRPGSANAGVNAGGGNGVPGLIFDGLYPVAATDNDNLLMWCQTDGIAFNWTNCEVDALYRGGKTINTYTDGVKFSGGRYRAAPFSSKGSAYQSTLYAGTIITATGNSSSGGDTWLSVANLGSLRMMPQNTPVPVIFVTAPTTSGAHLITAVTAINANVPDITGSAIYWAIASDFGHVRFYTSSAATTQITIGAYNPGAVAATWRYFTQDQNVSNGWIYEQTTPGDGLIVNGFKGGTDTPSFNLSVNKGAVLSGLIGPAVRLNNCQGVVVNGYHWDSNQTGGLLQSFLVINSEVTFVGGWSHAGPAKVAQSTEWHFININDSNSSGDAAPQTKGSTVITKGLNFSWRYDHTGNNVAAEDFRYPDINLLSFNQLSRLRIENPAYYHTKQSSGTGLGGDFPDSIIIGAYIDGLYTPVNNNSYGDGAAINAAFLAAGSIVAGDFELTCTGTTTFNFRPIGPYGLRSEVDAGTAPTITANSTTDGGNVQAGTPYNYQCAVRNVDGSYGPISAVATVATPVANSYNEIVISGLPPGPCCVVVWASINATPSATPTQYQVVPLFASQTLLIDTGLRLNGRNWITSSVPAVATATDYTWPGYVTPSGNRVAYLAAAPSSALSGPWSEGDLVWNIAAAHLSPVGWICTVAGSPGTWVAISTI